MSFLGGQRWTPLKPSLRSRRPHAPASAEVGRWNRYVDNGPDGRRVYYVYKPPGLRRGTAAPLVVVLHGCNQSAQDAALGTEVNVLADREGFVAVYPEQSVKDNSRHCWNWFEPRHQVRGSGEPAAIARITERVLSGRAGATLDRNRVHVMGISAGGAMAGILAATYPDVYASAGIHSAPEYRAARNLVTGVVAMASGGPNPQKAGRLAYEAMGSWARVVPVVVIQGEMDRTVRATNGDHVVRQWLTTSGLAGGQGELDFAEPSVIHDDRAPGGLSYTVRGWNDQVGRPVVQYWTVSGLGHAWSGGAAAGSYTDPRGPNATEAMYEFFRRCPKDRGVAAVGVDAGLPKAGRTGAFRTLRQRLRGARRDDAASRGAGVAAS